MKKITEFNIIITGVGGQGLITLLKILAQAAFLQGFDVKTSELRGLSQREGSVSSHLRFGQQILSPLIQKGKVDLILALETSEALRISNFANTKTIFVINEKFISYLEGPSEKEVSRLIKRLPGESYLVEASSICKQKFGKEILSGVYLLGYAVERNLIPLKNSNLLKAIEKTVSEHFSLNKTAFEIAKKDAGQA